MLGIVSRACTAGECEIVARTLALGSQLLGCCPHQWMEPVDGAGETPKRVADEVVPTDVSQLVEQHCTSTIEGPRVALGRQNNRGVEDTARKRHLRVLTAQESWRLLERESVGYFPERSEPVFAVERTCTIDDAAN